MALTRLTLSFLALWIMFSETGCPTSLNSDWYICYLRYSFAVRELNIETDLLLDTWENFNTCRLDVILDGVIDFT